MKLLKKYFKIVHQIYDYFDYTSGEKIYPIEDYSDFEWTHSEKIKIINYRTEDDDDFMGDDYIEEYKGEEFTMFLVKDSLNLDDCLVIFDNKKYLSKDDYKD